MLAAGEFEFKQRFWIIGAIFCLAFLSYNLDPQNAGAALTEWIARLRGTTATRGDYHLTFAIAALFTVAAALVRTWATAYLNPVVVLHSQVQTSRLVADGPLEVFRTGRMVCWARFLPLSIGGENRAARAPKRTPRRVPRNTPDRVVSPPLRKTRREAQTK